MEEKLVQDILNETFTRSALHRRISLLRTGIAAIFFTDIESSLQNRIDSFIDGAKLDPTDKQFFYSLAKKFFPDFSKQTIPALTSRLEDMNNKIPILMLSIPVEISEIEANNIGQFVRRTFGKMAVVDFRINPTIIGGCGISWKGVYYDFSLSYYIKKNREKLITLINSYAKNW